MDERREVTERGSEGSRNRKQAARSYDSGDLKIEEQALMPAPISMASTHLHIGYWIKDMQIDLSPISRRALLACRTTVGLCTFATKYDINISILQRLGEVGFRVCSGIHSAQSKRWEQLKASCSKTGKSHLLALEYWIGRWRMRSSSGVDSMMPPTVVLLECSPKLNLQGGPDVFRMDQGNPDGSPAILHVEQAMGDLDLALRVGLPSPTKDDLKRELLAFFLPLEIGKLEGMSWKGQ
ncbi:hypothetical protein H5410_028069 [Solanum commersonii]|uniref:Uncharacterized protein n=1 Tax=Solanum commersonii TaxID=4109 RepID=A0A9J5Z110_SOLCO|nr:hypothetical protein H5410_028069 [Solanum commersonii]